MNRLRHDDGTAVLELVWLSILLLIPLVYVVMVAATLQRAAFATTAAARDAARAYATASDDTTGEARAELAVRLSMDDQHVDWNPTRVVECGDCSFAPGSSFRVVVRSTVRLPWIPPWLCGARCPASIPVQATHTERIDCYRAAGSSAPETSSC